MATYSGTFTQKIDKKQRVSVPAPFRDALKDGNDDVTGFYLRPSFVTEGALEGLSAEAMEKAKESLSLLPEFSPEREALGMVLFGRAMHISWDGEGRIGIPESLREFAKITDEVVFVGGGEKFTVWAPEAHAAWEKKAEALNKERLEAALATFRKAGAAA